MTQPEEPEIDAHQFCSVECPCGHWNEYRRRATTRADGRRGKPNLDIVEENGDAAR
jgi:hypothetical protein